MTGTRHDEPVAEVDLSIVCVVGRLAGDMAAVHRETADVVTSLQRSAEFVYVFNGPHPEAEHALSRRDVGPIPVRVYRMAKGFGEASALDLGFSLARGKYVITIPDRFQAEPMGILRVLEALDRGYEVVVTRREPRRDPWINRLQSRIFHFFTRQLSGRRFRDMTCALRGLTREASRSLELYGDLHRFLPILAAAKGFRVEEVAVLQRDEDAQMRVFGPGVYARRLLDILHVFFLARFTRKPLRFFGLIGLAAATLGFLISGWLTVERLFGGKPLTDRPLLLLGVLLIVLGVQVASMGLIGELVIFLSAKEHQAPSVEVDRDEDR